MQQSSLQLGSPAHSSPSNGFFGPRASPWFSSVDQPDPVTEVPQPATSVAVSPISSQDRDHAPPMQLANAQEGLSSAIRIISSIRADSAFILESFDEYTRVPYGKTREEVDSALDTVERSFQLLKAKVKELEAAGLLVGAVQRYNHHQPWDSKTQLICTDGAIGAYAWKRHIAGQAAATAVERSRLAVKSFEEQRKRLFPRSKRVSCYEERPVWKKEEDTEASSAGSHLADLLTRMKSEAPGITVTPLQRLDWARQGGVRSSPGAVGDGNLPAVKLDSLSSTSGPWSSTSPGNNASDGESKATYMEKVAILDVKIGVVARAVISLLPAGSVYPDALAIFAADEVGSQVHAWGVSQHALFQKLADLGVNALHYFRRHDKDSSLELLLKWLSSHRSLFTKPCCTCQRLLARDPPTDVLLPPLVRPYWQLHLHLKPDDSAADAVPAFHISCAATPIPL